MSIKKIDKLRLHNFVKLIGFNNVKEVFILNGILKLRENLNNEKTYFNIDCKNCIVCPGFVDLQVNGLNECNFWDFPSFNEIDDLRLKLAHRGIVAFCPTIITGPQNRVIKSINHINSYITKSSKNIGAKILGIHLEGIFITKYGVHDSRHANHELTIKNLKPYLRENLVLFTLAPELDKTGEAIKYLQKNNVLVSIGHSNASYKEGELAIEKYGIRTVTHMFNSLRGIDAFSHRDPKLLNFDLLKSKLDNKKNISLDKDGIMLALLRNKEVLCMVISDGLHVHKNVVKLLKEYKSNNHFALASDVVSKNFYDFAKSKGNLGGSQTLLDKGVSNLITWRISSVEEALYSASSAVSRQLKVARELGLGQIAKGNEAMLVLWDTKKNATKGTIIGENVFLNY